MDDAKSDDDEAPIQFSDRERLILAVASEVAMHLASRGAIDPMLVASMSPSAKSMRDNPIKVDRYAPRSADSPLTPREYDVLLLLLDGKSNRAVGKSLGISSRTVEVHRMRIMEKLGAKGAIGLANAARQAGIVA